MPRAYWDQGVAPTAFMYHQFTMASQAWGGDPQVPGHRWLAQKKYDDSMTSDHYWEYIYTYVFDIIYITYGLHQLAICRQMCGIWEGQIICRHNVALAWIFV